MAKNELIIYEGALCCSTGICGPEPDKSLIELNEALRKSQGDFKNLKIIRASLSHNAQAFLENEEVLRLVKEKGTEILPITVLNGRIISKQRYMKYDEMKEEIVNNWRE
jgi:hypothetical protein